MGTMNTSVFLGRTSNILSDSTKLRYVISQPTLKYICASLGHQTTSCRCRHLVAAARHGRNVRPATAIRELAAGVRALRAGSERNVHPADGTKKNRLAVAPPAPPAPHRHIITHRPLQNHPRHLIQAAVRSPADYD